VQRRFHRRCRNAVWLRDLSLESEHDADSNPERHNPIDNARRFYCDSFHLGYFRQGTELLGEALDAHTDLFRDVLGENTPTMIEIRLPPRLEALLAGEPTPPLIAPPVDPNWRIPDSPPAEWRQQLGEEPADDW
jgi:hypothetical protein